MGRGQGFRSLTPEQRHAVASRGGKAAQAKGTAHKWDAAEAQAASLKAKRGKAQRRAVVTPMTDEEARSAVAKAFEDMTR